MDREILTVLFNNAALLLVLAVIYEISLHIPKKYNRVKTVFCGIFAGLICGALMMVPFNLESGIIIDSRTVLISTSALIYGPVTTVITVIIASVIRFTIGGIGTTPGIILIFISAILGLTMRRFAGLKVTKKSLAIIYLISIVDHLAMLFSMLILPYPYSINVIRSIAFPVMLLYPSATVLLSLLLMRQKELKDMRDRLMLSEAKFKSITENMTDIVWQTDLNLKPMYVTPSVEKLLGESVEEYLNKGNEEKFSQDTIKKLKAMISEELEKEKDPASEKNRIRTIEVESSRKNGSTLWLEINVSFIRDKK